MRVELTGVCDFECLYCHAGDKNTACYKSDELTHERRVELIKEAKDMGVKRFTLTGGEPFLYKRWPEVVEVCGSDSEVVISTNGAHFSNDNIAVIADLPQVVQFTTSLDGLKTNDIIREGSDHRQNLKDLARLKRLLPKRKLMVQTVVYRQNLEEIIPLYEELKDIGIFWWRLSQLWKTVRTERNKDIVDFSDYQLMFDLYVRVIKRHLADSKPFQLSIDNAYYSWITEEGYAEMDPDSHPCAYNFDRICLNANGDLMFCPSLGGVYASAKDKSLTDVISSSPWLKDFKTITVGSLGCAKCRYFKICGGGCRADAHKWLGNVRAIDPNSCCMMPLIEERIIPLLKGSEREAFQTLIVEEGEYPPLAGVNIEEAVRTFERKEA